MAYFHHISFYFILGFFIISASGIAAAPVLKTHITRDSLATYIDIRIKTALQ
jgi:hypothetical protein